MRPNKKPKNPTQPKLAMIENKLLVEPDCK